MEVNRADPAAESPATAGLRLRRGAAVVAVFLLVLWIILGLDAAMDLGLRRFGVRPRSPEGLLGLLTMPLLHGGAVHLLRNSFGMLLLGTGLFFFYPDSSRRVLPWFWTLPGLVVWLIGSAGSIHYGASGLNFAIFGYLALGGLLRRDAGTLALSLAVLFYFGSMFSGILPVEPGISWEGHLGGLLVGFAFAVAYRSYDIPLRKRYAWEDEEEDEDDFTSGRDDDSGPTIH